MKKRVCLCALLCLVPFVAWAVPSAPTNLKLSADTSSITVTWNANSDTVDKYNIYKGTTESDLVFVGSTVNTTFVISNLEENTTYYVALTASDSTGESSQTKSSISTTATDTSAPEAPTGLAVSSSGSIDESSIPITWSLNSEDDVSYYIVYYGTSSGSYGNSVQTSSENINELTISNLSDSTRYYISVSAVDEDDNESDKSDELIVDTLVDNLAPFAPSIASVELSNAGELTVTIDDAVNDGMADLNGYYLYCGTQSQVYGDPVFIDEDESTYVVSNLDDGQTYYFVIAAIDDSGNESTLSDESSVLIEGTILLLNNDNLLEGGCFINQMTPAQPVVPDVLAAICGMLGVLFLVKIVKGRKIGGGTIGARLICGVLLMSLLWGGTTHAEEEKLEDKMNIVGVTMGYTIPSDKLHKDIYESDQVFKLFIQRRFLKYLAIDLRTGYVEKEGNAVTVSGKETLIETELKMIPTSGSLTFNYDITPHIVAYFGGGLDYWYCREKSAAYHEDTKVGVGGYHGKLGVKLYTEDRSFDGFGVILESSYSSIDRFEENMLDLGGWNFDYGFIYKF